MLRLVWELLVSALGAHDEDTSTIPDVTKLDVPIIYLLAEDDRVMHRSDAALAFTARLGVEPVAVLGRRVAADTPG